MRPALFVNHVHLLLLRESAQRNGASARSIRQLLTITRIPMKMVAIEGTPGYKYSQTSKLGGGASHFTFSPIQTIEVDVNGLHGSLGGLYGPLASRNF
jgi:hypothetical protein